MIRLSDDEVAAFTRAAHATGLPVSAWMRMLGRRESGLGANAGQDGRRAGAARAKGSAAAPAKRTRR